MKSERIVIVVNNQTQKHILFQKLKTTKINLGASAETKREVIYYDSAFLRILRIKISFNCYI